MNSISKIYKRLTDGILHLGAVATAITAIVTLVAYFALQDPSATPANPVAAPAAAVASAVPPAGSPEEELTADLNRRMRSGCGVVVVTSYARKDTPAAETTHGQPATYIEATAEITTDGKVERSGAAGSGRGPGAVGAAESSLLDNLTAKLDAMVPDCF